MTFRVEPGLDGTKVYASRPASGSVGQGLIRVGLLGVIAVTVWGAVAQDWQFTWNPLWIAALAASVVAVLVGIGAALREKSGEYEILLDAQGVAVDGERMDLDVQMVLHAEKLVFRDSKRQIEVWHGIPDLEARMKLREVLESALSNAHARHGAGAQHIPEALRERP